jgi:FkbM family methyltransferase
MAKAVRAGARLGDGAPAGVQAPVPTVWQRIGDVGRAIVTAIRWLLRPISDALMFVARGDQIKRISDDVDDLRRITQHLVQLSDFLMERADLLLLRRAVQLGEREVLVRTPYGWLIVPAQDEVLLTVLLDAAGVLEPGSTTVMTRLIHDGDTVVDVGANIGLLTVPAARRVGPSGRVVALEPLPVLARVLQRSMHINGVADRVTIHTCAAAAESGTARIHISNILGHSSLLPVEGEIEALDVTLRPLDDLIAPRQAVSFVKIDAEGYELPVFRGMQRIVAENPDLALIVEFGPSHLRRAGVSIEAWLHEFTSQGFRPYEIDEQTGRCAPLREHGLDTLVSVNLLMLRRPQSSYPDIEFV